MKFILGISTTEFQDLLLQMLIGRIAGLAAYTRFRWHSVKGWLQKNPGRPAE